MSDTIATEEAVRAAIKKVQSKGLKVTNQNVHHELGGGSMETIAPIMKCIRTELPKGDQHVLPAHLSKEADVLVRRLYGMAKEDAEREYQATLANMSSYLAGLQEDLDTATADAASSRAVATQLRTDLDAAEASIGRLTDELASLSERRTLLDAAARTVQVDLNRANDMIASLKSQADERSLLEQRLSRLEAAMPKAAKANA